MQKTGRNPVQFKRPPVVEVVCGIAFGLEKPLRTAHVGLFWALVQDEFPRTEDAEPLALMVENPAGDSGQYNVQFEFQQLPPLRRSWLLNSAGTNLLQIQDERFLFNWKRTEAVPDYPSYVNVIAGFRRYWARFKQFARDQGLGEATPRQMELTYFNLVPTGHNFLIDHQQGSTKGRFLTDPEGFNWRTQYLLPEMMGRLHVIAVAGRNAATGEKVVRLECTARGLPKDLTEDGCNAWFDLAHEWITQGFTDLTTPEAHAEWGRTA